MDCCPKIPINKLLMITNHLPLNTTGNMSWMMRVQNQQTLVASGGELPLHDLSVLFAATPSTQSADFSGSLFTHRRIDSETLEDEKYEVRELLCVFFVV